MELYAIRNKEGNYFRAKGYGGYGNSWVDSIEKAKIYTKQGVAKAQITFWAKNYPKFGVPDLVILEANVKEIISQETRTEKVIEKQKQQLIKEKVAAANRRKESIEKEISKLKKESMKLNEKEVLERGYF